MKKSLFAATVASLLLSGLTSTAGLKAALERHASPAEAFSLMPKSKALPAEWRNLNPQAQAKLVKNRITAQADFQFAPSDNVAYLDMPDGSTWFVVSNFDKQVLEQSEYYTDYTITGIHATVYNDKYQPVGKIEKTITLPEGFKRCNRVEFGPAVTKKFFNLDDNYELMLLMSFNPSSGYGSVPVTQVLSLRGAQTPAVELTQLPGYYMSAINNASDAWSEDFFMQFFSGEEYTDTEMLYSFDIYSKAGYGSNGPTLLKTFKEDMLYVMSDGENEGMPVMINSKGRQLYVTSAKYQKTFLEDPFDFMNETVNPDNHYLIDLYQKNGSKNELVKVSTTSIPCEPAPEGMFMRTYSLGMFQGYEDIAFDFTADSTPAFILSICDTDMNENTYTHYRVYNTAGELLTSFGEGNQGYLRLSSVAGHPEQFVFLNPDPDSPLGFKYSFHDYPSMDVTAEIPVVNTTPDGTAYLSMNLDRAAAGSSYRYAFSSMYGDSDEAENTLHDIHWFNADGSFLRTDRINAGQNVNLVNPLVAGYAMNPYLFNTDAAQEYIYYVLRRPDAESTQSYTELCVGNSRGETLMQYAFDPKASQMGATIINLNSKPAVWINYMSDGDDKVHSDFISLPLNKLEGQGTSEAPYLIANAGDFSLIGRNPQAHYAIAADIDFQGNAFTPIEGSFSGSLNGNGHKVEGFTLADAPMFDQLAPADDGATVAVKNLRLSNITVGSAPAVLASRASRSALTDIRIANVEVGAGGSFGTIAETATTGTVIEACGAKNVTVNRPEAENVGGLAAKLGTDACVKASSFSGSITAGSMVGGIAASAESATSNVTDCHVNASLTANYAIGGLLGSSVRSLVEHNVVEGDITALEAGSRYSEAAGGRVATLAVGGLIGDLQGTFASYDDNGEPVAADTTVVVKNNVVALTSITLPAAAEGIPAATDAHRIIGRSRVDSDPEYLGEEYDPATGDWVIIWGAPAQPEQGLAHNYSLSTLPAIDAALAAATATEGADIEPEAADRAFFASLGYAFDGYASDAPWVSRAALPSLYFESSLGTSMAFRPATVSVAPGEKARALLQLEGIDFEALTVEISDEAKCMANPVELDENGNVIFEIEVTEAGTYTVRATNGTLEATLTVIGTASSAIDSVAAPGTSLTFDGHTLRAPGQEISLYTLTGTLVARGASTLTVAPLAPGIYIASTPTATLKIAVK